MALLSITKREIIACFTDTSDDNGVNVINVAVEYILSKLNLQISDIPTDNLTKLRIAVKTLRSKFNLKWKKLKRTLKKFEAKNATWLNSEFLIPHLKDFATHLCETVLLPGPGRPSIPFHEKSHRSKRREAAAISNKNDNDPLRILMACRHAARFSKETDLAAVLQEIENAPENISKIRKMIDEPKPSIMKLTPEQALSFLLDRSLSKDDYVSIRLLVKRQGADIFPPYDSVRNAKAFCRPPQTALSITEYQAKVSLQSLLDHTAKRIFDLQKDVLLQYVQQLMDKTELETMLICSWGFDGSTGHSPYKQKYRDAKLEGSDENLFATTLIPLRWLTNNNVILWNNRASQSVRFCRPINLQYVKETTDVIRKQKEKIEAEINQLRPFEVTSNNVKIFIHFSLCLTLIDGKVLNIVTNTNSTLTCPICHATPKQFNNFANINRTKGAFIPDPKSLQYGVSPLHAWIRLFECVLHIAYRLCIKAWQVRTYEQKIEFARRKAEVQKILWEQLGLNVDKPKPGGSGTTNDGNMARRAFEKPDVLAELLGLDRQMLQNFKTILIALSCELPLDPVRFDNFAFSTAEIYIKNYSWYPMPSTVHKILVHGGDIIRNSLLPLGMLGEEASEARNKYYKSYRRDHARNFSRADNLKDVFNRAMDTSDPIISSLTINTRLQKKEQLPLPTEVIDLLAVPTDDVSSTSNMEQDEDEQDYTSLIQTYELLDELDLSDEEELMNGDLYD